MIKVIAPIVVILTAMTFRALGASLQPDPPLPPTYPQSQPPAKEVVKEYVTPDERFFPDGVNHDFGVVPRGIELAHAFRIVNKSTVPLRIHHVRVSMNRSLKARPNKDVLEPNEEGLIEIWVDTNQFVGPKTGRLYVTVNNGKWQEHRLWVVANSRNELEFNPHKLDFGKIKPGKTPTENVVVTVLDYPKMQITAATCKNKLIQVDAKEIERTANRVSYRVSATVSAELPEGTLTTDLELTTNNPAMPKLRVPLTIQVERAEEKIFPDGLSHDFGKVPRGALVFYAFRMVNPYKAPLQIHSLRTGG